jgi:hypothetical protein
MMDAIATPMAKSIIKWEIRVLVACVKPTATISLAAGRRSDMKLENLLKESGAKSLTDFRKNYDK